MPWMIVHKNGKHCVHEQNEDKSAGKKLHCYDNEAEANDYLRALYAHSKDAQAKIMLTELEGESLSEKIMDVQSAFDAVRFPTEPMPPTASCYIVEVFDDYVIADEAGQLFKVSYSTDADGKITFEPRDKWQTVKRAYVASMSQFSFTELNAAELGLTRAIDGMAAGTFTDMRGEEITFDAGELPTYIENTKVVLESTRTESGELVGLPIDKDGHDHAGGAGWIIDVELDEARKIIRFLVNWTQEGMDLIKNNIRRYFSPSVDMENKSILGGSLTNWPASRNAKGQIMLRPIELSQSMKEIDMTKTLEEMSAEIAELREELKKRQASETPGPKELSDSPVSPQIQELLRNPDVSEEMGRQAQEMAQAAIKAASDRREIVEFCAKITGGDKDHPIGLPVRAADLAAALLELPDRQRALMKNLLLLTWEGAVDFTERGINSAGNILRKPFPAEFKDSMRDWVKAGNTPESFFAANPEIGKAIEFNLAEFKAEEV